MTPQEFEKFAPLLLEWLKTTLAEHSGLAFPVASKKFSRLPLYFPEKTLNEAKVVVVEKLPMPPLSKWGLTQFADFENGNYGGMTYLDTFFVKPAEMKNESMHFHELIHIIQWRVLGPERFLFFYANGLEQFGYRNSPLEKMAYDAEAAFNNAVPFDAEELVKKGLGG